MGFKIFLICSFSSWQSCYFKSEEAKGVVMSGFRFADDCVMRRNEDDSQFD